MKRLILIAMLMCAASCYAEPKPEDSDDPIVQQELELINVVRTFAHGIMNQQYDYRERDAVVQLQCNVSVIVLDKDHLSWNKILPLIQ